MCSTCRERLEYALHHASVADVLRVEQMTAEQQERAVRGVWPLIADDLEAEIIERTDREHDDMAHVMWLKDDKPRLDDAVAKIRAVRDFLSSIDVGSAEQLDDALALIEDVDSDHR